MNLLILKDENKIVKILAASTDINDIHEAFHYAQNTILADNMDYITAIDLLKCYKSNVNN
jgi:hypothetical protein